MNKMRVIYGPETDVLSLILRDKAIKESDGIREGIIIDYGEDGKVIAMEIFDVSENIEVPEGIFCELKETKITNS